MIKHFRATEIGVLFATIFLAVAAQPQAFEPLMRTVEFQGVGRKYFVALPNNFDPGKTYWPLVVVHGGGGGARTNPKAVAMRRFADSGSLQAIMILPEFITEDKQVSRFPSLGEDAFLKEVLKHARAEFKLHTKILLNGYSMGGQFSHRFALANPEMIQACAAFAAGTWTTPDGRLLIEEYGEVKDPKTFLSSKDNAEKIPERLRDLFDPRTAGVAGLEAAEGAAKVPFLIMCGTLDTRYGIAVDFASCLRNSGLVVETEWPATPHTSELEQYRSEYEKYSEHAVRFFKQHTERDVNLN